MVLGNKKTNMPTIISPQTVVCGDISASGCVDVAGKVIGNIKCNCLVLRKNGIIEGDIVANTVILDGLVMGVINAHHAHLKKYAIVEGSLVYSEIITEQGARIVGQLTADNVRVLDKNKDEQQYISAQTINVDE